MFSITYIGFRCLIFRGNGVYGVQLISEMIENKTLNIHK